MTQVAVRNQPTEKGLKYQAFRKELGRMIDGARGDEKDLIAAANEALLNIKLISPSDVHSDATLSTLSKQYANDDYIGEQLLPPVPVGKRSDRYATYGKRDRFSSADDEIGPDGDVNQVIETRAFENYSVKDYALKNYVLSETLANQDAPLNEMVDNVEAINDRLLLRREKRIRDIVFTAGNYGGNTAAVAGGAAKWDDASGGTIIANLLAAVSALYTGRNPTEIIGVCGRDVWNVIANNAKIKELFLNVREGLAQQDRVASYFGMDRILVGDSREDTANVGAAASFARIWSTDNFAVLRVAKNPGPRSLQFGTTFRMNGDPTTNEWFDPSRGKGGAFWAKVGVSEDHKVIAGDAGFLLTDVLT